MCGRAPGRDSQSTWGPGPPARSATPACRRRRRTQSGGRLPAAWGVRVHRSTPHSAAVADPERRPRRRGDSPSLVVWLGRQAENAGAYPENAMSPGPAARLRRGGGEAEHAGREGDPPGGHEQGHRHRRIAAKRHRPKTSRNNRHGSHRSGGARREPKLFISPVRRCFATSYVLRQPD